MFTSGSVGTPKGVVIEHSQLSASSINCGQNMGFQSRPRVFQFASYAFDACILEIITTLVFGGTICIPSEFERKNAIADTMRRMEVTCAFFTPSLLAGLEAIKDVPTLDTLIVGGESIPASLIDDWAPRVRLILAYGPTECCVICFSREASQGKPVVAGEIGRPFGVRAWVVKEGNVDELAGRGERGELLLEGPVLARGYLHDAAQTAKHFIRDPAWTRTSDRKDPEPRRLYRTGDLVQYLEDGTLRCLGRLDNQIKVRGQRLELGEVEQQLYQCFVSLPDIQCGNLVVDAVNLRGSTTPTLVAFLGINTPAAIGYLTCDWDGPPNVRTTTAERQNLSQLVALINARLKQVLPLYAIPSIWIPLLHFPLSASGKTDRKRLRNAVTQLSFKELSVLSTADSKSTPAHNHLTERGLLLRTLWADVLLLSTSPFDIDVSDNFFALGGDSARAIRLVAAARAHGIGLTVEDIFRRPVLGDMAQVVEDVRASHGQHGQYTPPFSLLRDPLAISLVREQASRQCLVPESCIEDIYPCSSTQSGLLAASLKDDGAYVMQLSYKLPASSADVMRLKAAWERVAISTPVMRTRFFECNSELLQAVLREPLRWEEVTIDSDLATFLKTGIKHKVDFGQPLSFFTVLHRLNTEERHLVWTIHHSLTDRWAVSLIEADVEREYFQQNPTSETISSACPFNNFIRHVVQRQQQDEAKKAESFWRQHLAGATAPAFPPGMAYPYSGRATKVSEHRASIPFRQRARGPAVTTAVMVHAAWSLLVGIYSSTSGFVLGVTLNGRTSAMPSIDTVRGPTLTTVPFRMQLDPDQTLAGFLAEIQDQYLAVIPFQQYGLDNIRRSSADADAACQFSSLLVIQPAEYEAGGAQRRRVLLDRRHSYSSLDCALMMECELDSSNDRILFRATFDEAVLSDAGMRRMLQQFEHLLHQVASDDPLTRLSELRSISEADERQIMKWNGRPNLPTASAHCVHELVQRRARTQPNAPAVCAWDGDFSYEMLDAYSSRLAAQLSSPRYGVGPESPVLLCFEKSKWMAVSALAVLKAGGVCVPVDPAHPTRRLQATVGSRGGSFSRLMLTSVLHRGRASDLQLTGLAVDQTMMDGLGDGGGQVSNGATPANAAFILFTSGSTGTPKGIVLEHQAFCSSAEAHGSFLGLSEQSRVLQFAAHTFDLSMDDIFTTLIHGGCVCIPSEDDRMNNLSAAIEALQVNYACLMPSVASTIEPDQVPSLRILATGGEMMTKHVIEKWAERVHLINMYGPAECSIYSTGRAGVGRVEEYNNIGRGVGAVIWLADPQNTDKLTPIGGLGELLIEGPNLARGYLDNESLTKNSFIVDPAWSRKQQSEPSSAAQTRRFYKSGDLGYYNPDGSITVVGRNDDQVKLRGQRLEIGEVEYQLQRHLPATVDVAVSVVKHSHATEKTLAAFLVMGGDDDDDENDKDDKAGSNTSTSNSLLASSPEALRRFRCLTLGLEDKLRSVLPSYMVPPLQIPVRKLPRTASGKVDRKALRGMVASLSPGQLSGLRGDAEQNGSRPPSTKIEKSLQRVWKTLFHADRIGLDDDFFRLGGDSVLAMRLVALARREGMALTVSDIFKNRKLEDMALAVRESGGREGGDGDEIPPFSLIRGLDIDRLRSHAAQTCKVSEEDIEDIYPSTAFQRRWIIGGGEVPTSEPRYYQSHAAYLLPPNIHLGRFRDAWSSAVSRHTILRTRFVRNGSDIWQVVIKETADWRSVATSLQAYMELDRIDNMDFGSRLLRFAIVTPPDSDSRYFVLTIEHAIYDGFSLSLLFSEVEATYFGDKRPNTPPVSMSRHIKYLVTADKAAAIDFWAAQLAGAETGPILGPLFPDLESRLMPTQTKKYSTLPIPRGIAGSDITLATMIGAAIGLVFARDTGRRDVIFRCTRAGRNGPGVGIEELMGPTVTTVPVRIHCDPRQNVVDLLQSVQRFEAVMVAHDHLGYLDLKTMAQFRDVLGHTLHVNIIPKDQVLLGQRLGLKMEHSYMRFLGSFGVAAAYDKQTVEFKIESDDNFVSVEMVRKKLEDMKTVLARIFDACQEQPQLTVGDVLGT